MCGLYIYIYCAPVGCVAHILENLDASFSRVEAKKDTGNGNGHIEEGSLSHLALTMGHKKLSSSAPSNELPFFSAHHEQTHHHYLSVFYMFN